MELQVRMPFNYACILIKPLSSINPQNVRNSKSLKLFKVSKGCRLFTYYDLKSMRFDTGFYLEEVQVNGTE